MKLKIKKLFKKKQHLKESEKFKKILNEKKEEVKLESNNDLHPNQKDERILRRFTGRLKTEYITGRDVKEFIKELKYRIKDPIVVVDIRWNTYHKSKQGFDPAIFKKILEEHGIEYLRIKELGNPFHELYDKSEFIAAKQDYQDYLKHNSKAQHALQEFMKLLRFRKTYCLICYCPTEDPNLCHRFWLKETMVNLKRDRLGLPMTYKLYPLQKTLMEVLT